MMYFVTFLAGAVAGAAVTWALFRAHPREEKAAAGEKPVHQSRGYDPLPLLPSSIESLKGWVDYDRPSLKSLSPDERIAYFNFRVNKVVIRPLRVVVDDLIHMSNLASALLVYGVSVCSAIEATGRFVNGDISSGGGGKNQKRFRAFVDKYMDPKLQGTHKNRQHAETIWRLFRNGLAHGFTVSEGGFEGNSNDPYIGTNKFGALVVNPYRFFADFCQGFERYIDDLRAAQPNGQLYTEFDKVFTTVFIDGK